MRGARTALQGAAGLFLFLTASGLSGCAAPQARYMVSLMITEPTEPDDAPGIHMDSERGTAHRPWPIPVRGFRVELLKLQKVGDIPDPQLVPLARSHSTQDGCVAFFGHTPYTEGDLFRLRVSRKGYLSMYRDLSPQQVMDADMTIVVQKSKGGASDGPDDSESEGPEEGHDAGAPAEEKSGEAAPPTKTQEGAQGAASPVRAASGDEGAAKADGAGAKAGEKSEGEGEKKPTEPVRKPVEPDAARFEVALQKLRAGLSSLGWKLTGIDTREDGSIYPEGWPKVKRCRAIKVDVPEGDASRSLKLYAISTDEFPRKAIERARSEDGDRAAYVGEVAGYHLFVSARGREHAEALRKELGAR